MAETKIKAGQFSGIVGHGTDGYFLMTNGDGTMAWAEGGATGPSVTSVSYPGDDLAADPAGGQTVVLTGTNFGSSMTVSIGGTTAPSVAHDSSTQLTITTPAKAAGDYDIVVTNTVTGASGTFVNGISYNGIPTWTTTAGSLGTFESETTISTITLQATEPDGGTITFNITNGALPTGLSLTGANIDGTTTAESSTTLYSFTIEAIDDENQSTPRNFSITVNAATLISSENFTINTYTGNGSTQAIEGKIGTAASFNGSSSIMYVNGFDTTTNFSISLWFKTSSSSNQVLANNGGGEGANTGFLWLLNTSGKILFATSSGGGNFNGTPSSLSYNDGNWHNAVLNYASNGVYSIYVDNQPVVSETSSRYTGGAVAGRPFAIGAWSQLNQYWFNGSIDQVRIFNRALDETTNGEVTTLYGENNASSTKSTTDIFEDSSGVALYEFEEVAKDTGIITSTSSIATYQLNGDATDVSTNYDGADTNVTWGGAGKFGTSAAFNGSSSKIQISGLSTFLGSSSSKSWSCWVKTTSTSGGNRAIISDYNTGTGNYNFDCFMTPGDGRVYLVSKAGGTGVNILSSATINNGVWHHICAVQNTTTNTLKLYIDSNLQGTISIGTGTRTSPLFIGTYGVGYYWDGSIDQVRIYNKALSADNVNTLYNETLADSSTNLALDIHEGYNGTPTNVSFVGTSFQPDLVWAKVRDGSTSHVLFDSVRGRNSVLYSNLPAQEVIPTGTTDLLSFDSNGFTVGPDAQANINTNGNDLVAWCWKAAGTTTTIAANTVGNTIASDVRANQEAGFSIVKYTTPSGGSGTVGHGLSSVPEIYITKRIDSTSDWYFNTTAIDGSLDYLLLNSTAQKTDSSGISSPTSTVFSAPNFGTQNEQWIAYCFHSVDSYQKVGSYTGTGVSGNTVTTGFEPRFVMWKAAIRPSGGGSWYIFDSARTTSNPQGQYLQANESAIEADGTSVFSMDFNSNGFTINATNNEINQSGSTYIYLAIA